MCFQGRPWTFVHVTRFTRTASHGPQQDSPVSTTEETWYPWKPNMNGKSSKIISKTWQTCSIMTGTSACTSTPLWQETGPGWAESRWPLNAGKYGSLEMVLLTWLWPRTIPRVLRGFLMMCGKIFSPGIFARNQLVGNRGIPVELQSKCLDQ